MCEQPCNDLILELAHSIGLDGNRCLILLGIGNVFVADHKVFPEIDQL